MNNDINKRSTSKTINNILETAFSSIEHKRNLERCLSNINNYNRIKAWNCLQDMISQYSMEITILGSFTDGTHIIYNLDFNSLSDDWIINQLNYISNRILLYALIKECSKKTVRMTYNWLAQNNRTIDSNVPIMKL